MVDFGNSVFEGKLDASVPLLNPVDDRSGETFAGALADGIDRFNKTVFSPERKAAQADAAKNGLFSDYAEKISLIADAKDQGMSTDEAMRNVRVEQNKFLSNNPELADEFFTFSNKVMSENGFGGVITKETPAEAGRRKYLEEASSKGWDVSNPQSLTAYDNLMAAGRELAVVNAEIDRLNKNGESISARVKDQAIIPLHKMMASTPQWVTDRGNKLMADLNGVTDPAARQAIIDQFQLDYNQEAIQLRQFQSVTGEGGVDYLLTGTDQMVKNLISVADGTNELASVKTFNESILAKNQAMAVMNNPKLARLLALDGLSKFQLPSMLKELDAEMLNTYAGLNVDYTVAEDGSVSGDKPSDVIESVDSVAKVFNTTKSTVTNILKDGGADKEAVAAQAKQIVNLMRSAERYGANDSDPRNFTAAVDFFADPTIGKFIEQNGSLIYPQIAAGSKQVIEQQYGEVVLNLINERWATATEQVKTAATAGGFAEQLGLVGNQTPGSEQIVDVSKFIEPVWNGVGIEFKVNDAWKNNPQLKQIAKDLNQGPNSITAPLNKLIRASAHLSGSTDYEKTYNEEYLSRLWVTGEKPKPTMDQLTGKDLSGPASLNELTNIPKGALEAPKRPDDYKETTTSLRGQTGQLLDAIGAAEGATYNTLFGYAERPEGAFAGTNITNMTIKEVQALQKEMVKSNGISSAVGKYQFIQDTLKEAIKGLGLKGDEKFTPELQDKLAVWLLKNRTSFDKWTTGEADAAAFQNELASQWASVPNTSGKSAYAGDGVNNATAEGKRLIGLL